MAKTPWHTVGIGWLELQLALRVTAAAVLSLATALLLGLQYPIYAFIAAVIVTDLKPQTSQTLGQRRLAATVVGAICGAGISLFLPASLWSVGLGLFAAMLLAQLVRAGEGARVAGYISGIVLLDHSAAPWTYAFHRFAETAIGVLFAWGISFVPKLIEDHAQKT